MALVPSKGGALIQNPETDTLIPSEDGGPPRAFRRKIVRRVKQPYTVQKKVQVSKKQVVPCELDVKVPATKLKAIADFEEVDEPYFEMVKETVKVPVKTWTKSFVEEEFVDKVPVVKTRTVKKPVVKIKYVDTYHVVKVPGTKIVEVEGWRIDEIEDRKLVEVEEYGVYEWQPHATGQYIRGKLREVGVERGGINRKAGTQIYAQEDLARSGVKWDELETDTEFKGPVPSNAPLWGVSGHNPYASDQADDAGSRVNEQGWVGQGSKSAASKPGVPVASAAAQAAPAEKRAQQQSQPAQPQQKPQRRKGRGGGGNDDAASV